MKKIMLGMVMTLGLVGFSQAAVTDNDFCRQQALEQGKEGTSQYKEFYDYCISQQLTFGEDSSVLDEAVLWSYSRGLTIFNTTSDYQPNTSMRRDEAAKLYTRFAKLAGKNDYIKTVEQCKFSDLNDAHADLKDIIVESCRLGIFQGANGKFMPRGSLTNEQAVAVLVRIVAGNQNEIGLSSRSENYYKKASELLLLSGANINNRKVQVMRGDVVILLFNARESDSFSSNYDTIYGLGDWANSSRSGVNENISLEIQSANQKINNMIHAFLCLTYPDEIYCADLGFDPTISYKKEFWNKFKEFTNNYLNFAGLNDIAKRSLFHEFLIKYYYGMIDTKQYTIAQKMQGGDTIKSVSRYQDTYNDGSTLSIELPNQINQGNSVRYATKETCSSFKNIQKKFTSLFTYLDNSTYRFPVIMSKINSSNNIVNTVYEVTKKITADNKIVNVSSNLVGSYTLGDWSVGNSTCN